MGFFKRLFGIEVRPGEPAALSDMESFNEVVKSGRPSLVYFYHLWCSSCQVMGGLLNEIGPGYVGRIDLYKLDIHKVPGAAAKLSITGVTGPSTSITKTSLSPSWARTTVTNCNSAIEIKTKPVNRKMVLIILISFP